MEFKIRAKTVLKINCSVKTQWRKGADVARSGLWAPDAVFFINGDSLSALELQSISQFVKTSSVVFLQGKLSWLPFTRKLNKTCINCQALLNGKEMEKTGMHQNTRLHVGVYLCFRDVYFLRSCFRREKVHPAARVTPVTVLPVFAMCVSEANTHANDGTL